MKQLEKYRKNRTCPKCGGIPNDKYTSRADVAKQGFALSAIAEVIAETIKRKCVNCHYIWYEKPLDIK